MRTIMMTVVGAALVFSVGACKRSDLNEGGQTIKPVTQAPNGCEDLGFVIGRGGGSFGGGMVKNEKLIEYAMNDARNKASDMGGTHLLMQPPQLGAQGGGRTSTVTVTGNVYRCAQP